MSRSVRFSGAKIAALVLSAGIGASAQATIIDSATIVPGSFVQGAVRSTLAKAGYQNTSMDLSAWPLNTGGNYAINFYNPQYQLNKLLAFGNGGTVELQLNTAIIPTAGQKDLGIFTAQAILNASGFLNANMEAAILVSQDGQNWYNLAGVPEGDTTTARAYTGLTYSLNAPTMAYNYGTNTTATAAGKAQLSAAQLAALPLASYTTPMPDDTLFNNPSSTNAQRNALFTDSSAADYTAEFGASGGGNWFDVSGSGLSSISYVMLNGDANIPSSTGGDRLENVFVNSNATLVPEPGTLSLLGAGALGLLRRSRRK